MPLLYQFLRSFSLLLLLLSPTMGISQVTVTSFSRAGANPTNAATVNWYLSFSEPVTGVSASNFSLVSTGSAVGTLNSVTSSDNQIFEIIVSGVSGEGTLVVNLSDPASITGISGPLVSSANGPAYDVDRVRPNPINITKTDDDSLCTSTVNFRVEFSEPVQGVTPANFSLSSDPGFSAVISVSPIGDGTAWNVSLTVNSGEGNVSIDLSDVANIRDLAGNNLIFQFYGSEFYTLDRTPPQPIAINRLDDSPTSASTVRYEVVFHELAGNVTTDSFEIDPASPFTGTISSVTSSDGLTWIVTVDSISNNEGLMPLSITDDSGISDDCGNITPQQVLGNPYQVDRLNPSIETIQLLDPAITPGPQTRFAVQFRETVTTLTLESLELLVTRDTTATLNSLTTSDNITFVLTFDVSGPGTLQLIINNDPRITDLVSHPLINMPVTSAPYTICLTTFDIPQLVSPVNGSTVRSTTNLLDWNTLEDDEIKEVYLNDTLLTSTLDSEAVLQTPLAGGYYSWYVKYADSCTSGPLWDFTVLDPAVVLFPTGDFPSCNAPEMIFWEPVDSATTYTIFINSVETSSVVTNYYIFPTPPAVGSYTIEILTQSPTGSVNSDLYTFNVVAGNTFTTSPWVTDGQINTIVRNAGETYIGGKFNHIYDDSVNQWKPAKNLAIMDSTGRDFIGQIETNEEVTKLLLDGSNLYVGGNFTAIKGVSAVRVAKIDLANGNAALPLVHLNGKVNSLTLDDDDLIIGGSFTKLNSIAQGPLFNFATNSLTVSNLIKINTATPYPPTFAAGSINGPVHDVLVNGGVYYVGGAFTQFEGQPLSGLVALTPEGSLKTTSNFGINGTVYTLEISGSTLFAGGSFTKAGVNTNRNNLASFNIAGTTPALTTWNPATDSAVYTIAYQGGRIYAGGTFSTVRQSPSAYFAAISAFGSGQLVSCGLTPNNVVRDIIPDGALIYVGGNFDGNQ